MQLKGGMNRGVQERGMASREKQGAGAQERV
jgi:hypothetical protein